MLLTAPSGKHTFSGRLGADGWLPMIHATAPLPFNRKLPELRLIASQYGCWSCKARHRRSAKRLHQTGPAGRARSVNSLEHHLSLGILKMTDLTIGKRRRPDQGEGEDEDTAEHKGKNQRILDSRQYHSSLYHSFHDRRLTAAVEQSRRESPQKVTSQPLRKSPRLREIRDLNRQRTARSERRKRSTPVETLQHRQQHRAEGKAVRSPQEGQPQMSRVLLSSALTSAAEQQDHPEEKEAGRLDVRLLGPL